MRTQICSCCGEEKSLTEFHTRSAKEKIYHRQCKVCLSRKQKVWRMDNVVRIRQEQKKYREENKEIVRERKRRDYLKHKPKYEKRAKERYDRLKKELGHYPYKLGAEESRFGRHRIEILERDNYECQECGSTEKIIIHHIDKTGRTVNENHNNGLDNLITLCRKCHINIHREDLLNGKI